LAVTPAGFWKGKRIAVTGATGFIGSNVIDRLTTSRGVAPAFLVRLGRSDGDLRHFEPTRQAIAGCDIVLHLAADTRSASHSSRHPAAQLYNNTLMDLQVLEAARQAGVGRVLLVGCVVAYSAETAPLTESRILEGPVPQSSRGISQAKRNGIVAARSYHQEFGLNVSVVVPANTYGPGDELDLAKAHVVPATILKCLTGDELVAMGNPETSRDFAYVEDVAEGILLAAERLPAGEHVNIGSGVETTIGELVRQCVAVSGFKGKVRFDGSGPQTPQRRPMDISRGRELLGFSPAHTLEDGLRKAIAWYRASLAGRQ
jgi:GDP-L-fucose synthase